MIDHVLLLNRWLYRFCFLLLAAGVFAFSMPWLQAYQFSSPAPAVESYDPVPIAYAKAPHVEHNIFDPVGQLWVAQGARKKSGAAGATAAAGDVNGVISIPGVLQGVMAGDKFVPVGGQTSQGSLQAIENGRVKINTGQGVSEIDINEARNRKRQSLQINIK